MTRQEHGEQLGLEGPPRLRRSARDSRAQGDPIETAVELARTNDAAWQRMAKSIVDMTAGDDHRRRELLAAVKARGRGKKSLRPRIEDDLMLAGLVRVWTEGPDGCSVREALKRIAKMFPELYPADCRSLENRLRKARKRPDLPAEYRQDPSAT